MKKFYGVAMVVSGKQGNKLDIFYGDYHTLHERFFMTKTKVRFFETPEEMTKAAFMNNASQFYKVRYQRVEAQAKSFAQAI